MDFKERLKQETIELKDKNNELIKALELGSLYKELATLYRDRFDYNNSATEIKRLWGKIKELEND